MTALAIRPFEERDTEAVAALWRRVFPDAPPWNVPENDIRMKLGVQRELFLVGTLDGAIVATAMAGYDGHRGTVFYVAVTPEHRRRGFGRDVMREAEHRLRTLGCPKFNLQVRSTNRDVIAFYERLGFEIEDRVSMSKRLG